MKTIYKTFFSSMLVSVLIFCPGIVQSDELPVQDRAGVPDTSTKALPAGNTDTVASTKDEKAKGNEKKDAVPAEEDDMAYDDEEETPRIADPLAPLNKVMFHFNDKLYFWALKPVTQVYSHIIPEDFRVVIGNAYDNLKAPGRMLNNLLQLRFKAAGNELIRFVFNSFAGVGGLGDAAKDALGIVKQEADFGQTLGRHGIGHGIYIILPVFGPSSARDTVGLVGDRLMYPLTYIDESDLSYTEAAGIATHEKVNDTSFRIGDYESFKDSAIDPYISMRDAFVQYRKKKVEEAKSKTLTPQTTEKEKTFTP